MSLLINSAFKSICLSLLCLVLSQTIAGPAIAKKPGLKGPVSATIDRVIDGDTIRVKARIWLNQDLFVLVRLSGIDTAELNSTNPFHRQLATTASKSLQQLTYGRQLTLRNIRHGKYAGRVIADVFLDDGTNLSNYLLKEGLAVPYGQKFNISHP